MKNIVITGASTGIGYALCKIYLDAGYRVFGSVRKQADADRLQSELGKGIHPMLFDVTHQEDVEAAAAEVKVALKGEGLALLINNAGIATSGPLMLQPLDELRKQFEINVIGLFGVTQAFLPLLGAVKNAPHPPGRIINISSVGGKIAAPFLGAYSGSKHALEGMSESLRRELQLYGIDVIVVGPGAIKTPIWDKPSATDLSIYNGTDFEKSGQRFQKFMLKSGRNGMEADDLAQRILKVSEKKKPKTRYTFAPKKFRDFTFPLLMPKRMVDRAIAKNLGLSPGGKGKEEQGGRYV